MDKISGQDIHEIFKLDNDKLNQKGLLLRLCQCLSIEYSELCV